LVNTNKTNYSRRESQISFKLLAPNFDDLRLSVMIRVGSTKRLLEAGAPGGLRS